MTSLIFMLVTLGLFGGFIALTKYETVRGVRFFVRERTTFDQFIKRLVFIRQNVNFLAFSRDFSRQISGFVAHYIAHLSLQVVRWMERLLTRIVRHFRERRIASTPAVDARAFVKTLSDFKETLKATHPDISKIQ